MLAFKVFQSDQTLQRAESIFKFANLSDGFLIL